MKITRSLSTDGTFEPAAVNFLGQIPESALFYVSQQLRHPESIYALSLTKVSETFSKVTEGYLTKTQNICADRTKTLEMSELLKDQESFLRALQEHLDDCWLILKTLVDPATATKTTLFADKYVVDNKLPGSRTFRDAIADYKATLRIANKLKHQQGRLRGVSIQSNSGPVLGYFLEGPDAQGIIGPSPEIHPDQGAFSFARDLTWHLFNVYACSEKLVSAIRSVLNAKGLSLQRKVVSNNKNLERTTLLAAAVPPTCFPKEVPRHIAIFRIRGEILTIEFPKAMRPIFPSPTQVTCSTIVDGHSPSFKVPFP
jgi:hypothetical protein